ncbi:hypothetical protein NDU88_012027 [Pleurodeles waltl]|uniref:Myb/SANT-like DNA-binding domain-containing protein n=1 Tax=Pleurodeles waltl TaxID=8319 RepID=A0AAV7R4S5_PLEWA|nr:hypothetical protein NDU88_012027 [Pleurodeles waltl]
MAPQQHPRFSEEELKVIVEEIIRVEPQLFGSQVQQTSIARKVELWQRIVYRVNAVGQHPRTRDDIRKRTCQSAVCPPLQGPQGTPQTQVYQGPRVSGSGHTVQETEAQDNREAGRTAVRQGEDRPREPTLQEALTNILGAYHHSQETMGQILDKLQETQQLQEEQYLEIRKDLKDNTTLVTIAGLLADMANTMRETVAYQRAPDTIQTNEQPSTSAAASGQEAPQQDQQATSTPPPAEGKHPANGPCDPGRSQRLLQRPRQEIRLS